jgi:hypothetical protein
MRFESLKLYSAIESCVVCRTNVLLENGLKFALHHRILSAGLFFVEVYCILRVLI